MIQRSTQFWFFIKGSGNSFSNTLCVWFFKKMFLMICSINWPNSIDWLPFLLEILFNMCIAIVCWLAGDVIDFEINLIFLIRPFSYTTKKSRRKLKYLENEKSFYGEIKSIFHICQMAFKCQKLSQTLECAFK